VPVFSPFARCWVAPLPLLGRRGRAIVSLNRYDAVS